MEQSTRDHKLEPDLKRGPEDIQASLLIVKETGLETKWPAQRELSSELLEEMIFQYDFCLISNLCPLGHW